MKTLKRLNPYKLGKHSIFLNGSRIYPGIAKYKLQNNDAYEHERRGAHIYIFTLKGKGLSLIERALIFPSGDILKSYEVCAKVILIIVEV